MKSGVNQKSSPPPSKIFTPRSVGEVLDILAKEQRAELFAGGCSFRPLSYERVALSETVVALDSIRELRKSLKTETYHEIGAMLTLSDIYRRELMPQTEACKEVIFSTANHSLRNRITIGGNIKQKEAIGAMLPILSALDALIEVRSLKEIKNKGYKKISEWVSLPSYLNKEDEIFPIKRGLITKVRIPLDSWSVSLFSQNLLNTTDRSERVLFCGFAKIDQQMFSDVRLAFSNGKKILARLKHVEANIVNRQIRSSEKLFSTIGASLKESQVVVHNPHLFKDLNLKCCSFIERCIESSVF